MRKLVKPTKTLETMTNEVVYAFCEYDACSRNCKCWGTWCRCYSVGSDIEADEDVIF